MFEITYFQPNWGWPEIGQLIRSCLPFGGSAGRDRLEDLVGRLYPGSKPTFYSSGKSAIYALLRQWGIGPGDEVLIPAFICASVAQPVFRSGAKPIAVDVDPRDLNISLDSIKTNITPQTKAVIVAHLYGNPADIEAIESFCRARHIRVLDDAAPAFGGQLNDRFLGQWGDGGLVSLGPGKSTVGPRGAVALTPSRVVLDPGETPQGLQVISDYMRFILLRCLRQWTLPVIQALRSKSTEAPPVEQASRAAFNFQSMAAADACIAALQFRKVLDSMLDRRQANYHLLKNVLGDLRDFRMIESQRGKSASVKFAFVLEKAGTPAIFSELRRRGLEIYPSYTSLRFCKRDVSRTYYADQLDNRVVELPLDLSEGKTQWMADVLRTYLKNPS